MQKITKHLKFFWFQTLNFSKNCETTSSFSFLVWETDKILVWFLSF